MHVIYLDQNAAIDLAEGTDSRFERAREIIFNLVDNKTAVFPYSEIHLLESANMSDASKTQLAHFWERISGGYRFAQGKDIRARQFVDLLHGKPMRFWPHLFVFQDVLNFAESVDLPLDPTVRDSRSARLREVVGYWASLTKEQIYLRIRNAEAATPARMLVDMFDKALCGELPSLVEIDSEYNTISSELAWAFRDLDAGDDAWFHAVRFMRDHALEVPAVEIECVGLEALAEQYAIDNPRRRAVEKSQLDHDSNDLSVASDFVPYCVGGMLDANAITIVRRAYKKMHKTPPNLFSYRVLDAFNEFLQALPKPEEKTVPQSELERSIGRVLFTIPRDGNELIGREALGRENGVSRELLPFGGLKVSSESDVPSRTMLTMLESIEKDFGAGGEAILYGGTSTKDGAKMLLSVRVPFGMFDVGRTEIEAAVNALDAHRWADVKVGSANGT
jgi:hypothetical protein